MGQTRHRGAPPPPAGGPPVYDVIAPAAGESLDVCILDEMPLGVMTHWVVGPDKKGRSRACELWRGDCAHCEARARELWLGFISVYVFSGRRRAILRVGPETAKQLAKRARPFAGLAGVCVRLSRGQEQRTGALLSEESPFAAPLPLPRPLAIEHTLCIVLGTDSLPEYRYEGDDIPLPPPEGGAQ